MFLTAFFSINTYNCYSLFAILCSSLVMILIIFSVLQLFLSSPKPSFRYAGVRTLNKVNLN